jgi:hypothetical protein
MKKILIISILLCATFSNADGVGPANWSNAYTGPDGKVWSDILPKAYVNCISYKDSHGNPVIGADNGLVACERDSASGLFVGDAPLGDPAFGTVLDSDAIRACKEIGGRLPTLPEYLALGLNFTKLSRAPTNDSSTWATVNWTSTLHEDGDIDPYGSSFTYVFGYGTGSYIARRNLSLVRCVSP